VVGGGVGGGVGSAVESCCVGAGVGAGVGSGPRYWHAFLGSCVAARYVQFDELVPGRKKKPLSPLPVSRTSAGFVYQEAGVPASTAS